MTSSKSSLVPALRRFIIYARKDVLVLVLNMLLAAFITLLGALMIWTVGWGINSLRSNGFSQAPMLLGFFATALITLQGLRYLSHYIYEWMQQRVIYAIRRDAYEHLLRLSLAFRDTHEAGDILSRLGQDITRVSELIVVTPGRLFAHAVTLLTYVSILFYIDYRLALAALCMGPLFWLHQKYFSRKARIRSREFLAEQGKMGGFEEESLANLEGINAFAAERSMLERFDQRFERYRVAAMSNLLLNNLFVVSFELLAGLAAVVLIAIGFFNVSRGYLGIGELVNFLLYLLYLSVPLRGLANVPVESQIGASAAERVAHILDASPMIEESAQAVDLGRVKGELRFDRVDFGFCGSPLLLSNFSLQVNVGEFVAVLGHSGVGKSSFAKMLQRFYDPLAGSITLDGVDLRQLKLTCLRANVSVVSQEPFIIDDTVSANLRLAQPLATEAQIEQALHDAYAWEFVADLAQKTQTRLGARGSRLSVGQRQRIALARAFVKGAPILILDEATSALDSRSEQFVQQAIEQRRRNSTLFVIAHRYATIMHADKIVYFMGQGECMVGTHAQLIERCEPYRESMIRQGYHKKMNHSA